MKEKLVVIFSYLFILCGLWAISQIWFAPGGGLGLTNLDNTFVFGFWIIIDLVLIALGSGAFCTALLCYIFKRQNLKSLLPLSVALGLLCYACAGYILLLEIGQPLRFWFPFRHPNFISMLTEITFCITLYSLVLTLEFLPVMLGHKRIDAIPFVFSLRQKILTALPFLAFVGAILSILHQGSLGGVYGVLFARPFAFRPGFGIWPWTFVLFTISAMAVGPLFVGLVAKAIGRFGSRETLNKSTLVTLARFGAIFLGISFLLRSADVLLWKNWLLPLQGLNFDRMFNGFAYGKWLVFAELVPFTLLPILLLSTPKLYLKRGIFSTAALLACFGLILNRYITNTFTMAVPTFSFESWEFYWPNFYELAPVLMTVGIFVLGLRFLFKHNFLFPPDETKG